MKKLFLCLFAFVSCIAQERIVRIGDTELFCQSFGEGAPLIVIHGGPGLSQDYLLPYMEKLAEKRQVIFYDQRGSGRSTGQIAPETMTLATFVEDLDAIRKAFCLDRVSILGHSWGGFLAMQYAIAHPESVDKLILANSMPASSTELQLFYQEWMRRMAPFQEALAEITHSPAYQEGDPEAVERFHCTIFRTYCNLPEKAELLNLRLSAQASIRAAKVYQCFRENVFQNEFDLHSSLQNLNVPTLVLHGDVDPIPPSTAERTHQSIPHSQYILMEHCGHFPYVEDPEAFFQHLNAFLE